MTPDEISKLAKLADEIHDAMRDQVVKGIKIVEHGGILSRWEQEIRRLHSDTDIVAEARGDLQPVAMVKEKGKYKN